MSVSWADPAPPGQIETIAEAQAGGACGGYGLLLDISDVPNPVRIDEAADINMSFWHSATFSNDASKILFSDEWGGGSQPRCRETLKLHYFDGRSASEVARELETTTRYAEKLIHNCLKRVREIYMNITAVTR